MRISNSKKQLAKIISENGGWRRDGDYAAQDKDDMSVCFYSNGKPTKDAGCEYWSTFGSSAKVMAGEGRLKAMELCTNWHQTILSRDEYFHLHPAPDDDGWIEWKGGECPVEDGALVDVRFREGVEDLDGDTGYSWAHDGFASDIVAYRLHKPERSIEQMCSDVNEQNKHAHVDATPTIEQLAAEYRNRQDYAERKRQEADAAKAEADAKLAELVAAGKAVGLVLSVAAPEPELQVGDEIEYLDGALAVYVGMCGVVDSIDRSEPCDDYIINVRFLNGATCWCSDWRFIRRPAKGDTNA